MSSTFIGSPDPSAGAGNGRREVAILANPSAGTQKLRRPLAELLDELPRHGLVPIVCWERSILTDLLRTRADQIRCVIAAGGDGTLQEVINRAASVPIALLPLGNENLAARYFGIARCGRRLAETVADGQVQEIDLGRANGRLFSIMAGAGFDAEVVHRVHRRRTGHVNKLSYLRAILGAVFRYRFPPVTVHIEDTGERLRGAMAFVFNLPQYALGLPLAGAARPDDGLLDLWVFERPGRGNLLRYLQAVMRRRHGSLPDVQRRLVRRVHLSSEGPLPLQLDGDPAGQLPVSIEVVAGGLSLLVPRCGVPHASAKRR